MLKTVLKIIRGGLLPEKMLFELLPYVFFTAIPRLEAPDFHIAVRNVDWGDRLLQVYRVNWGIPWYCCILVKFAADPLPSATVRSIHPAAARARTRTRDTALKRSPARRCPRTHNSLAPHSRERIQLYM
jgi:hypothetical protein